MRELRDPNKQELKSPLFNAIWEAIKYWDISRTGNGMYAGATGTDVCTILDAIKPELEKIKKALAFAVADSESLLEIGGNRISDNARALVREQIAQGEKVLEQL